MRTFAELAEQGKQALLEANYDRLTELFDEISIPVGGCRVWIRGE